MVSFEIGKCESSNFIIVSRFKKIKKKKKKLFWLYHMACGILVPWPGIKPKLPAEEVWRLNHCQWSPLSRLFWLFWAFCIFSWILFFKNIYLFYFGAVMGLCCCTWALSRCGKWELLFIAVRGFFIAVASLVAEHSLRHMGSVVAACGL